jgi:hypothetical protein
MPLDWWAGQMTATFVALVFFHAIKFLIDKIMGK